MSGIGAICQIEKGSLFRVRIMSDHPDKYKYFESEDLYDMACEWIKQKNYEKAGDYLKKSIALNPNFIYAYITMARILARQKKYQDAIHYLKNASKLDPAFDRLYFLMAKYAYRLEDYKNAIRFVDTAMDYNPLMLYEKAKDIIKKKYRSRK